MLDLHQQVWQCLDLNILDGALFAAEQYYILNPNDESKFLYGLVLFRLRKFKSAMKTLEGEKYLASAYVYGLCALELDKPGQGLTAMTAAKPWIPVASQRGCPTLAATQLLVGKLHKAENDRGNAVLALAESAKLDPYLLENVTALLQIPGYKIDIEPLFYEQQDDFNTGLSIPDSVRSPISIPRTPLLVNRRTSRSNNHGTPLRIPSSGQQHQLDTPIQPPPRSYRNITPTPLKTPENPPLHLAPRRRKVTRRALDGDDTFLSPSSLFEPNESLPLIERPVGTGGVVSVQDVYKIFCLALKYVTKYEVRRCLQELERLPHAHQVTPAILAIAARCHFELLDYKKSAEVYKQLREIEPYRVEDMEFYSTVLWQLKEEAELGFLAHEMMTIDREAWQTWCVMGNSFSLQHDTSNALECFQRATSLNPKCAVAYGLQGHEYLLNEEFNTAIDSFRLALRADSLTYNAWFGLSMVYFRLEQVDAAETNVAQALRINPNNPAMLCFMGIIHDERGENSHSISLYKRACKLQPDCFPARYQMACALIKQEKYAEALTELEYLRDRAPNDADVQFTLGKVYRLLNANQLAIKHLTSALSLDPKIGTQVRHELHFIEG